LLGNDHLARHRRAADPGVRAMIETGYADQVIAALHAWGVADPAIRTLILTSSRAIPDAPTDRLSDYDLIVALANVDRFLHDERWLHVYGTPLIRFDDGRVLDGHDIYARLVLYEDDTKIDYTLWPVMLLRSIAANPRLPDELDIGYRVLLDKDGLTSGMAAPTRSAYLSTRPTEAAYLALVEEFWWESTYVAKNLWRDELFPARYSFDTVIKFDLLWRMAAHVGMVDRGGAGLATPTGKSWQGVERGAIARNLVGDREHLHWHEHRGELASPLRNYGALPSRRLGGRPRSRLYLPAGTRSANAAPLATDQNATALSEQRGATNTFGPAPSWSNRPRSRHRPSPRRAHAAAAGGGR